MRDYRKLKVWQSAHEWAVTIYQVTASFPQAERYGLAARLRRAASSIPLNVAEGSGRASKRSYAHHLDIAAASTNEAECGVMLSRDLGYLASEDADRLLRALANVRAMLIVLRRRLLVEDRRLETGDRRLARPSIATTKGAVLTNETWRWVWTVLAVVMGVGEMFTAGFFLLPFAIGAAAAALLAWLDLNLLLQWVVFFVVSGLAFVYLRRFVRRQDQSEQVAVGALRLVRQVGVVLEDVDPQAATGMVRIEGEQWRATTDGGPIPAGQRVVVKEVRGTRLVVAPEEASG